MRSKISKEAIVPSWYARIAGLIVLGGLIAGEFSGTAIGDDVAPEANVNVPETEVEVQARELLRRALNARLHVYAGEVSISGRQTSHHPGDDDDEMWDVPISGLYCFNRPGNVYRYEGQVHRNVISSSDGVASPREFNFGYCKGYDGFAYWTQTLGGEIRDIGLYDHLAETELRSRAIGQPYDVMAFGMLDYHGVSRALGTNEAYEQMLERPVHSVEVNDGTVTIESKINGYTRTIVFDQEQLTPLRFDDFIGDRQQTRSTTEWQVISGVPVPVSYSFHITMTDGLVETFDVEMEWHSVNDHRLYPEAFTYRAFTNIPPNVHYVTDLQTNPPTTLGLWVRDGVVELDPRRQVDN